MFGRFVAPCFSCAFNIGTNDVSINVGNATEEDVGNCIDGIVWITQVFGDCVNSPRKMVGFVIGFVSLVFWLLPMIPQMIDHYRAKKCEGISVYFLLAWLCGDTCNMIGTLLTNQQSIQKITGAYFLSQDACILSQYIYYTVIYPKYRSRTPRKTSILVILPLLSACIFVVPLLSSDETSLSYSDSGTLLSPTSRKILVDNGDQTSSGLPDTTKSIIGYVLGICAAVVAFAARMPQLYRNRKRQTCEGLSLLMFTIIICANTTYGTSILLQSTGNVYIVEHLPWLVNSFICVITDTLVILQFFFYDFSLPGTKHRLITLMVLAKKSDAYFGFGMFVTILKIFYDTLWSSLDMS
ncbi:hypothetical protein AB6A40_002121 [Gnathostoma spinigerum]|uniref:Uncharacterized protein n=1 Tax=Gnathostoma spinigerum TaxID=75299 RepID=A0ABD6EFT8_9BILA